jgi:tetratricopeptide (TPR) repeat protein
MSRRLPLLVALIGAVATLPAPPATAQTLLPETFTVGRDGNGEPCGAARSWNDPQAPGLFDTAYLLTCRGVAASRRQGAAYAYPDPPPAHRDDQCGAPAPATMTGIGPVEARLCFDPVLRAPVVTIDFTARNRHFRGAAVPTALGPLEAALRVLARAGEPPRSREDTVAPSIAIADLASPPASASAGGTGEDLDAGVALQSGISLNQRGLFIEASRLLNDAISRLPARTPILTRAELALEAGLADSNISQFDAADEHFARAEILMKGAEDIDRLAFLERKRSTYRGLDLINRRQWAPAIALLTEAGTADQPLLDPAVLSELNQPPREGASASVSTTDARQLSRLLIEAQRDWARSIASLAIGDAAQSRAALDHSLPFVSTLQRSATADGIAALRARIERQYGRVAARAGRFTEAVGHFDCAIAVLQGAGLPGGRPCVLANEPVPPASASFSGGPLVAETQLERASLLARVPGTSDATLLADYGTAVDALIRSGAGGGAVQPSLEPYLDLLARLHARGPDPDLEQRFFRAIQAVGEPAIARQVAQLQTIVTSDSPLGAKARDRAEAEREIIRLRYEIAATDPNDGVKLASLDAERQAAEAKLLALNLALTADPRFRAVDDQPVTIDDVRAALRPDEYYVKVTRLRSRAYAMIIGTEKSFFFPIDAPAAAVDAIADRVRRSIRDGSETLPFFDVGASYALFKLIAGPAEATLASARALVIDPSGPLQNLPAGVLVTSLESVAAYTASAAKAPNDYSRVAFLGASAELSSALSPRSFLITRKLAPSRAAQPFIGFGENAPASAVPAAANMPVSFGTGCDIPYGELAEAMNGNRPVSAREIGIAAAALGVPDAPEVVRQDFTDTGIIARSTDGQLLGYQVLHFATHGVPETRVGQCTRVPPSLVTTLAPPQPGVAAQSDGLLSMAEVAQLRLDANLVVLSACETASGVSGVGGRLSGQDESAATLDGLVRAFVTANARAVLATYWQVPASDETDELIAAFYREGRGATIGAALRDAQRTLIAQPAYSHPYFWGAYFLVGDGSKTMLTPAEPAAPKTAAR